MHTEDLLYTLALLRLPQVGNKRAKKLIGHFGSAKKVFEQSPQNLSLERSTAFLAKAISEQEKYLEEAKKEIAFMDREKVNAWYIEDSDYPVLLRHCVDAPLLLFNKGNIDLHNKKIISIVGTRKMTRYGRDFLTEFIKDIASYQPVIISGLAYGIDITAQTLAMDYGLQTVACLAHGLHHLYPAIHQKYLPKIQAHGGILSEFWTTDAIIESNFVSRNRIIAGLSEATIIIESAKRGGAMLTAEMAWSYDREVFSVPGRTTDRYSQGCNYLLREKKAQILTSAMDLIHYLNWSTSPPKREFQKELFIALDDKEQQIFDYLRKQGKTSLDTIAKDCDMQIRDLPSILIQMELRDLITALPGKMFDCKK